MQGAGDNQGLVLIGDLRRERNTPDREVKRSVHAYPSLSTTGLVRPLQLRDIIPRVVLSVKPSSQESHPWLWQGTIVATRAFFWLLSGRETETRFLTRKSVSRVGVVTPLVRKGIYASVRWFRVVS